MADQQVDAEASRLVILGAASTGKRTLLEALSPACGGHADLGGTLVLDNKYYTAHVQLVVCSTSCSSTPDRIQGAHGLMMVIDGSRHATFTAAQQCLEGCDTEAADVRLLVCNKADLCHLSPAWHEEVRAWCVDNLFEFVLAAAGNTDVDAALSAHGEEQQGLGRVLAALEATMWPGMTLKASSGSLSTKAASHMVEGTTSPAAPQGSSSSSGRQAAAGDSTTAEAPRGGPVANGSHQAGLHPNLASAAAAAAAAGGSSGSSAMASSQGTGPAPGVSCSAASSDDEDDTAAGDLDANPFLASNAEGEWDEGEVEPPPDSEEAKIMASVQEFETVLAELGREWVVGRGRVACSRVCVL